jgi:anhydro-N-acetylmuramic acid kinase
MRVAGIMSGTSLDGIDVAIVDIQRSRVSTVAFRSTPYPKRIRAALLAISNAVTHTAEISRLNFLLGELYADAILQTCKRARIPLASIDLIGMHGQTIFHEGKPIKYLGRRIASTLQIGEAAVVAERTGIRVISNFRERDIAAGGQGAPLVPFVDKLLFGKTRIQRVMLNIGGIANITILSTQLAFDTGPGNMVMDALVVRHTNSRVRFDRNGTIASCATVNEALLSKLLRDPYFKLPPPKSCGREQYGDEFVTHLIATGIPLPDLIATATEFTAHTIALAIPHPTREIIASGGGIHNRFLMTRLRALLPAVKISTTADYGIDPDAKEAIAFAILAYEHVHGRPGNLPSATGARRTVVLGKSSGAERPVRVRPPGRTVKHHS